jgi:hypothetical protein
VSHLLAQSVPKASKTVALILLQLLAQYQVGFVH